MMPEFMGSGVGPTGSQTNTRATLMFHAIYSFGQSASFVLSLRTATCYVCSSSHTCHSIFMLLLTPCTYRCITRLRSNQSALLSNCLATARTHSASHVAHQREVCSPKAPRNEAARPAWSARSEWRSAWTRQRARRGHRRSGRGDNQQRPATWILRSAWSAWPPQRSKPCRDGAPCRCTRRIWGVPPLRPSGHVATLDTLASFPNKFRSRVSRASWASSDSSGGRRDAQWRPAPSGTRGQLGHRQTHCEGAGLHALGWVSLDRRPRPSSGSSTAASAGLAP